MTSQVFMQNWQTTIYAPKSTKQGHTITNLALHQAKYWSETNSRSKKPTYDRDSVAGIRKSNPKYFINIFHLGNSFGNRDVLMKLLNSSATHNIVILHDLDLSDLIRYMVNRDGLKSLKLLLGNSKPSALRKILLNTQDSGGINRASFFLEAFSSAKIRQLKIISHNSTRAGFDHLLKRYAVTKLELPFGHHFLKPLPQVGIEMRPIVFIRGVPSSKEQVLDLKKVIQEVSSNSMARFITIGNGGRLHQKLLRTIPRLHVLDPVTNINWKILMCRAKISVGLKVGLRGEASGFLRDGLLCSKIVLGDEESKVLTKFKSYNLLTSQSTPQNISERILNLLSLGSNNESNLENVVELEKESLISYFENVADLVEYDA